VRLASTEPYRSRRSPVFSTGGIVASSQPLASAAGAQILERGGNAADAAVAAAAALAVTQPCSTGLGGDCFALYYEAATKRVYALNGSGRSPGLLDLNLLAADGFADGLPRFHAHTVTVPGAPAGWADTVARFGRLPIGRVLEPAIRYAADGFPVAPMTAIWWEAGAKAQLCATTHGDELLLPDRRAPRAGERFVNRTLAKSLETMASSGASPFYTGAIAERVVAAVREAGGVLSMDDLAAHRSQWIEPISIDYRGVRVFECPPNGQGLAALIALAIAKHSPEESTTGGRRLHLLIEAMRLAFADAAAHIADPEFAWTPVAELLDDDSTRRRYEAITSLRASTVSTGVKLPHPGDDTVYLCAVDSEGNGCSFINSNYMGFGTGIVPEGCGYSLQNRGHNFSLDPNHPNRLEPRKRPYHTIIPALAVNSQDGSLYATFGVMGGFMQPQGHLQVITALVDDDLDPQAALDRGRFQISGGDPDGIVTVEDSVPPEDIEELRRAGHEITVVSGSSRASFGLGQIIRRDGDGILWAGSDPRGDGCATPYQ
jgi:gamma-glutamyltranspeptidase / glutathione hydrolase